MWMKGRNAAKFEVSKITTAMQGLHLPNKDRHSSLNLMIPGGWYLSAETRGTKPGFHPPGYTRKLHRVEVENNSLSSFPLNPQYRGSAKRRARPQEEGKRSESTKTSYTILSAYSLLVPQMTRLPKPEAPWLARGAAVMQPRVASEPTHRRQPYPHDFCQNCCYLVGKCSLALPSVFLHLSGFQIWWKSHLASFPGQSLSSSPECSFPTSRRCSYWGRLLTILQNDFLLF